MNSRNHIITGVGAGLTLGLVSNQPFLFNTVPLITYSVGLFYGSLLPDIDHEHGLIHHFIPLPTRWIAKFLPHREVTHTAYFSFIFIFISYMICNVFGKFQQNIDVVDLQANSFFCLWIGLSFGYLYHILMDYFSAASIRFFSPFTPYDKWAYEHYGHKYAKPYRWSKKDGKNVPIRHIWGRGYVVGERSEFIALCIFLTIYTVLILLWLKEKGIDII